MTNDELDELSEQMQYQYFDSLAERDLSLETTTVNKGLVQIYRQETFLSKKGQFKTKDWLDTMNFIKKIPVFKAT